VPPPTVSSSLAATTSTFPAGKDEEEEEEKGIDFGELVENPSDPKELKKQKRLIRNRMSAQLHRERKRAYIDKLEGEVKERDATISALQSENARLRRLLQSNGVDEGTVSGSSSVETADTDAAYVSSDPDSEGSDGTRTPPPRKRGASPAPSSAKSARLSGTGFLAAFACLMVFRSPTMPGVLQRFVLPSPPATPPPATRLAEAHRGGGRVLMSSFDDDERSSNSVATFDTDQTTETNQALALSVVPKKLPSLLADSHEESADHNNFIKSKLDMNSSYLFCPTMMQTLSEWRQHAPPLNGSEQAPSKSREETKGAQRLRHRKTTSVNKAESSESTAIVASSSESQATRRATSVAISKLLLARPSTNQLQDENATHSSGVPEGSLVPYQRATGGARQHPGGSDTEDLDGAYPYLNLVVPSSTLEGVTSSFDAARSHAASSSWVEIGCRMQSARFVDFSQ